MSQLSDQLGRVVGGRYRLIAPLGMGSSAQVFLADDVTLQRKVAVKMLQPALASDQHFLEHFRAEAQTVASINHPNVVVVHDSGVDDVPFLVTEYLAGGSLRGLLAAGHRLTPSQALVVGLDACRGLAHAHGRGLVHRDLKPANLCFGDDGRLRIADFGLARALAETGITDHGGHVVGTMRYATPEQARGERTGPEADVYALGLVLIEAVTGRVPFAGGDPIAALQARTHGDLEVPEALGPLRPAIERAGRLDPDQRADAEELGIALLAASERLTAPAPLPLVGALAEAGGTSEHPDERTQIAPAPGAGADEADAAGRKGRRARKAAAKADAVPVLVAEEEPAPRRRRRWPVLVAVLLAAAIAAGGVFLAQQLRTPTAEVPALAGRQIDDAELLADQNDWVIDEKRTRRDGTAAGDIVSTDPPAGDRLAEGGTLVVLVSEGNTLTDRPADLVGRPLEEVVVELERAGLGYEVAEETNHEEVPAGHVIGTAGDVDAELPKGSVVPLIVSLGPAPRTVPPLASGAGFDTMRNRLTDVQLEAERRDVFSETVPAGQIVSTEPAAGAQLERGSTVVVEVSKGPDRVAVPDLVGMTLPEAEAALTAAGLVLGQDCCASNGKVVGSDPGTGAQARRGTAVNIFLAR